MFPDVFRHDREDTEMWKEVAEQLGPAPDPHNSDDPVIIEIWEKAMMVTVEPFLRLLSIWNFYASRIEKGQRASSLIGNQYTGSIFLAMMSTL